MHISLCVFISLPGLSFESLSLFFFFVLHLEMVYDSPREAMKPHLS